MIEAMTPGVVALHKEGETANDHKDISILIKLKLALLLREKARISFGVIDGTG